jgi:hypothetical protein
MKILTKLEIIDETVKFYSKDTTRRSKKGGVCLYNSGDGRYCAVGRYLTTKVKNEILVQDCNDSDLEGLVCFLTKTTYKYMMSSLQKILKPSVRGHNPQFWVELQWLHDTSEYWCETGLTQLGELEVKKLKTKWSCQNNATIGNF